MIAKINKFINPSQVKSNGKSSRVKIDIVAEIGKTIDPNTYCQSRGLWFDAVLNSCVNWTYGGGKYTGGGTPYGAGRDGGSGPSPPSSWSDGLYGKDGYTVIRPSTYLIELLSITDPSLINYLNRNQTIADDLVVYLDINGYTQENTDFIIWAVGYLYNNPNVSFEHLLLNRTDYDTTDGDFENNVSGGYDNSTYSDFDAQQDWITIPNVIPKTLFVGWNRALHPNWQCMDYAKDQIKKKGFQISDYYDIGQTFQIYTDQNGVNQTKLAQGLSYLKYALSESIPVIVGVDDASGYPGNLDKTTDHFIVIVGMGTDVNGKYFSFYDNASGDVIQGVHSNNKLYYNSSTGFISGNSQTDYAKAQPRPYSITMIRKSKVI
ncbi:MAG: hypothetical protein KKE39_10000 [Bacteroidetes bacterium]|nr:hypothetical protein [Bacteroidota bacterium]MBU1373525.1 hypothetical protein [Bacteroidota bacterium]MBU1485283.1 hypothetical protein [Bacteroidota bacterium]MBU1759510.1 hypothetical protein [Bacteroidota bacterium]MBU2046381.1 hypothetical protein [Bacteroidota bacterium]